MENKESLWEVDDQNARLAELTSNDPLVKEIPLRRDVRSLGRLLGEVLKQQGGEELFNRVEHLRLLAIRHRDLLTEQRDEKPLNSTDQDPLTEVSQQFIRLLSVEQAYQLTKAFSIYFELTNLA